MDYNSIHCALCSDTKSKSKTSELEKEAVLNSSLGAGDFFNCHLTPPLCGSSSRSTSMYTANSSSMAEFSSTAVPQGSAKNVCNDAAGDASINQDTCCLNSASDSACMSLVIDHQPTLSNIQIDAEVKSLNELADVNFNRLNSAISPMGSPVGSLAQELFTPPDPTSPQPADIKTLRQLFEGFDPPSCSESVGLCRRPVTPVSFTVNTQATQTEEFLMKSGDITSGVTKSSQTSPQSTDSIAACKEWILERTAGSVTLVDRAIQTFKPFEKYSVTARLPNSDSNFTSLLPRQPVSSRLPVRDTVPVAPTFIPPVWTANPPQWKGRGFRPIKRFADLESAMASRREAVDPYTTDDSLVSVPNTSHSSALHNISDRPSVVEQAKFFKFGGRKAEQPQVAEPVQEPVVEVAGCTGGKLGGAKRSGTSTPEPFQVGKLFDFWHSRQQQEAGNAEMNSAMTCSKNRAAGWSRRPESMRSFSNRGFDADQPRSSRSGRWNVVKSKIFSPRGGQCTVKSPHLSRANTFNSVESRPVSSQFHSTNLSFTPNTTLRTNDSARWTESDSCTSPTAVQYESLAPTNKMVQLWSQVIGAHQSDADQHHQAIDALNSRKMESKMPKGSMKSKVRQKMDVPHTDRLSGSKPEVSCKKYPLKIAQGRTNVVKKCGGSEHVLQKPDRTEKSKLLSPRHQNVSKRCKGSNLADRCRAEEAILQANEVRKSLPKISRSSNYINQMEDILMSIKASASTQPELLERVNQCLRDRRLKRSSASSDLDKLEDDTSTTDCLLSAVSPSIKEEKPYSEGPPIPSLQLKSDCSSASKQSIDCVPVKEPEIKPAKSAPKVFLSVWSGLPADDKSESAVADMQGRQPPKSTTTMPDAQLTPGRADNSKTQSAPKSMSKLGIMVLPTTSSNIASVPRTFNSAKDETSIVPPSLIKAEVKAKKEFIDKVVNPGRDSDRKETGEETSGDNYVGTNSQPSHPASSKPEISRSSALPSAANREAGSSVYSLDSTFKDGHLPQKPPRKKHLSRSSSIVDGVTSPRAFLYANRSFKDESLIPPMSTASEIASSPECLRPKRTSTKRQSKKPSFTMPSSTRYERCPHCGSLPYSLSRETLQPSHPSRFRENTRSEPGKSLAKGGKERSRCGSCKSSQERGVAQWMSPHVDLWVQGQTNAESNFNNSAAYMKDGCVRESNTSQVRKQLSKPSVKKSLRSYAGGARQRRRPSSPHPDLCCFQRTQTSRDSSVKNT